MAKEQYPFFGGNYKTAFAAARRKLGPGKRFRYRDAKTGTIKVSGTSYRSEVSTPKATQVAGTQKDGQGNYTVDDNLLKSMGYKRLPSGEYLDEQTGDRISATDALNILQETGAWGGPELQEREINGQTHWVPVVTSKSGQFKPDTFVRANVVGDAVQHSGLRGIEVVGHRTHIQPRNSGFLPMYTPGHSNEDGLYGEYGSKNPIYKNISTGEYYMVHPKTGHIIASSPDENVLRDGSLWTPYHTGLYGDYNQSTQSFLNNVGAEHVAEAQRADENRRTNAPLHMEYDPATGRTYWMGQLTQNQFNAGQRNAVNNFASGVGNMTFAGLNLPNQAITGLGRVAISAINDGDYGWNNYLEGFGVKRNADGRYELTGFNNNSSVGLGDLVYEANHDVNPYVRTVLNFVNPESIAGTVSSIRNRGIVREGTPGTKAVKSSVTPTVMNAEELGYDYRDFGTEVAPAPYVVQYDPQVGIDPAWIYKILDAEYVPVDQSAGNDAMSAGDVQVEGSNGRRNDQRSQGRRSRSRLIKRNRQSAGKTDLTT